MIWITAMETKLIYRKEFFVIYNKKTQKYLSDTPNTWIDDYLDLQKDLFESYRVMKISNIDNAKSILDKIHSKKDCYIKKILVRTTIDTEEENIKC